MLHIQIAGSGCSTCKTLASLVEDVAGGLAVPCTIEKVQDINAILALGVLETPALLVNGVLKASGKIPSVDEVKSFLLQAKHNATPPAAEPRQL